MKQRNIGSTHRVRKKRCHEAKEHWSNTQGEEIEANSGVNSKIVHHKIKEVRGKKSGCMRSKDGDILTGKKDILTRWSEHITELYHDDRGPPPIINNDEGPQILEEEVIIIIIIIRCHAL